LSRWLKCNEACWTEAEDIARACLRAGVNVPCGDVLVYACATHQGVDQRERAQHFAMIRNVLEARTVTRRKRAGDRMRMLLAL